MKKVKITFLFFLLLCLTEVNAQTFLSHGTKELGGSILFSSQTVSEGIYSSNNSLNTLAVDAFIGWIFRGGFEMGLQGEHLRQTQHNYAASVSGIYLAPGCNIDIGDNVYPYFNVLFGYGSISSGTHNVDVQEGFGIGADAGLKVTFGSNSLWMFQFQYLSQSFDRTRVSPDLTFKTFSVGVGFRVFFPKKSETKVK
jgi:hypothetical protein